MIPGTRGSSSAVLSADGRWLAFTRDRKHQPKPNPKNPGSFITALSPDGSKIAVLSYRDHDSVEGIDGPEGTDEVYVADADGTHLQRVTDTPKMQESDPSWDPSGNRLGFQRSRGGELGFLFAEVVESNVDGSCARVVAKLDPRHKSAKGWISAPSWLPGEGRGVAPLSC